MMQQLNVFGVEIVAGSELGFGAVSASSGHYRNQSSTTWNSCRCRRSRQCSTWASFVKIASCVIMDLIDGNCSYDRCI